MRFLYKFYKIFSSNKILTRREIFLRKYTTKCPNSNRSLF